MEMKDIKALTEKDVNTKVEEIKAQLFDMRIQKATSGIEKSHTKYLMKKEIARLLTHKTALKANK